MMSRFTERAQEALQRAQQIMFAKQHTQLDAEHMFLALLQQRNSLVATIISRLGGDPQEMMRLLEGALNNMQSFAGGRGVTTGYITLRANRVLQGAVEEADRLNDEYISTEHIFLALVKERSGATGRILAQSDIDYEKAWTTLQEIRGTDRQKDAETEQAYNQTGIHTLVNPDSLVRPTGFSYGILVSGGRTLYLGGQIAADREGKIVAPGDVVGQYRQVMDNFKAVVEEAGGKMTDIVKMTIYVRDRDDYKAHLRELGKVHKEFFGSYYPAMALFEVSRFFADDVLVEIDGIAVLGAG